MSLRPAGSSELSSSSRTVWADLRRLFEDGGTDLDEISPIAWKGGGVVGGANALNTGVFKEVVFSLFLKVQQLPFILLRLPMELRMTVALLMDSFEMSTAGSVLRSEHVLIRFLMSEEKEPALGTVMASKSSGRTRTFWKRK